MDFTAPNLTGPGLDAFISDFHFSSDHDFTICVRFLFVKLQMINVLYSVYSANGNRPLLLMGK